MGQIIYKRDKIGELSLDDIIELYRVSTLGRRRPVDNRSVMQAMMENSDLIITAWDGPILVGISRTLTDFAYIAYLADLAVHADYQHQGIGKMLIIKTQEALEPTCSITLLAAPAANAYYPRIGFEHNPRAWMLKPARNANQVAGDGDQ